MWIRQKKKKIAVSYTFVTHSPNCHCNVLTTEAFSILSGLVFPSCCNKVVVHPGSLHCSRSIAHSYLMSYLLSSLLS